MAAYKEKPSVVEENTRKVDTYKNNGDKEDVKDDDDIDDLDDIDMDNEDEYQKLEAVVLAKYNDRFRSMDTARSEFEQDRQLADAQIEAKYAYDAFGRLQVNIPVEAALCELASGREAGKLNFTIEPLDKPDADETVVAKYTLSYHIASGDFYTERDKIRADRRNYGTAFCYTGITYNRTCTYTVKDDVAIDATTPFYDNRIYEEHKEDKYILTGKHVPLRHMWIDERCIYT
jgi:hypothetical protein